MAQTKKAQKANARSSTKRKAVGQLEQLPLKRVESSASKVPTTAKTGFLDLPVELRNEIYKSALIGDRLIRIRSRYGVRPHDVYLEAQSPKKAIAWKEPALLQVCKTTRSEGTKMYYGSNNFEVTLTFTEFGQLTKWLEAVVERCGTKPFLHFNVYVVGARYTELKYIHPLAHLFFRVDLQLRGRPTDGLKKLLREPLDHLNYSYGEYRPESVYVFQNRHNVAFQRAVEQAVELGIKARKEDWHEDWHEDWLDVEFGLLVEEIQTTGQGAEMKAHLKGRHRLKRREAKAAAERSVANCTRSKPSIV